MKRISENEQFILDRLLATGQIPATGIFDITSNILSSYMSEYAKHFGNGRVGKNSNIKYAKKLAGLTLLKLVRLRLPENSSIRSNTAREIKSGFVYLLKNDAYPAVVKIGITRNLESRMRSYLTADPYKTSKFIFTIFHENIDKIESDILSKYAENIISGEWLNVEVVDSVIEDLKSFG